MLDDVFYAVLTSSLCASPFIAALLCFATPLRRRYAAKWFYVAWLLLAVMLFVPFDWILLQAPAPIHIPASRQGVQAIAQQRGSPSTVRWETQAGTAQWMGVLWLSGAVLSLAVRTGAYVLFLQRVKRRGIKNVPEATERLWQSLAHAYGVSKPPEIIVSDCVRSPTLTGAFRTRLLLPERPYPEESLALILRHEIVHTKRHDLWGKLLLLLATCVHWFNPLVHLMAHQTENAMELSCDDTVTRGMDSEGRAQYGRTLLASPSEKRRPESMLTTSFANTKTRLKKRLANLFDVQAKRKGLGAIIALVAGVCLLNVALGVDSLPSLSVSADTIGAGEIICLGQITLAGGDLVYHASAESGTGLIVSLSERPDITSSTVGKLWRYYARRPQAVDYTWANAEPGVYYVYIGSNGTALSNVTCEITSLGATVTPLTELPEGLHVNSN